MASIIINYVISCFCPGPSLRIHRTLIGRITTEKLSLPIAGQQDIVDKEPSSIPPLVLVQHAVPVHLSEHAILGLLIAFCTAPSLDQIARVLAVSTEDVQWLLKPILSRSPSIASITSSRVHFAQTAACAFLETHPRESAACHARLACWCLSFLDMCDARDIAYAVRCWAYHVSQAEPSTDLIAALRSFALPLASVTEEQLAWVLHWLRVCSRDDVGDLIPQFDKYLSAKQIKRNGVPF